MTGSVIPIEARERLLIMLEQDGFAMQEIDIERHEPIESVAEHRGHSVATSVMIAVTIASASVR